MYIKKNRTGAISLIFFFINTFLPTCFDSLIQRRPKKSNFRVIIEEYALSSVGHLKNIPLEIYIKYTIKNKINLYLVLYLYILNLVKKLKINNNNNNVPLLYLVQWANTFLYKLFESTRNNVIKKLEIK